MRLWRRMRGRSRVTCSTDKLKRALHLIRRSTGKPISLSGAMDLALDLLIRGVESGQVTLRTDPPVKVGLIGDKSAQA